MRTIHVAIILAALLAVVGGLVSWQYFRQTPETAIDRTEGQWEKMRQEAAVSLREALATGRAWADVDQARYERAIELLSRPGYDCGVVLYHCII